MDTKKAIVLLSGGIDSATTAAIAAEEGYELSALTFSYGQRHGIEISAARRVAGAFGIKRHLVIDIPAGIFHSALIASSEVAVPKNREIDDPSDIPVTYVPARNIIFLSYALAAAESWSAHDIFIGANAVDYSGYPDCRPEFFDAFAVMANLGTRTGVMGNRISVHTPLINLRKSDIIKMGVGLGLDYALTHSCYDPREDGTACGSCDSCQIRKKGFLEAGVPDPTNYFS